MCKILSSLFSRIRRLIVEYFVNRAKKFGSLPGTGVRRLASSLVIKSNSASLSLIETQAISLVSAFTSIPVPRVRYYWEENDEGSIIMDYVEGDTLQRVWRKLTDAQRRNILNKLAKYVEELRAIPQPPPRESNLPRSSWIGAPLGHAFHDFSMTTQKGSFGPFANQDEFNDWRVSRFKRFGDAHAPTAARIANIQSQMAASDPIVFTHGDINRRNVIVRVYGDGPDDVVIIAVVDWEQSGWRPIHWESWKWTFEDGDTPMWGEFGANEIAAGHQAAVELESELQDISGYIP